jgi:RNA-directed DNA polymerase
MEKGEQRKAATADLRISKPAGWTRINWAMLERQVKQLQARIVKAEREGRRGKVRSLQRILTRSFAARALSVKRVTSNRGKRTSGVDGERWRTPSAKSQAIERLCIPEYKAQPLKRIYIPKKNGKKRPLGIPTMFDRAMQALHLLALDPVAECHADRDSYGFRKYRSTADAIEQCFLALARSNAAPWVLEADIKGCFDNIDHRWLLEHAPMERRVLRQWLKSGYMEDQALRDTIAGTPQGGIASPTLANVALDGLETELYQKFRRLQICDGEPLWVNRNGPKNRRIAFVRYADDFIVTGNSQEFLENEVKPLISAFLIQRGLTLSEEKTCVTHIEQGFDFLGMNIRKRNGKLLTIPSAKNVQRLRENIRAIVKENTAAAAYTLVRKLNPLLRGWTNYYRNVCSSATFRAISDYLYHTLMRWARRRHPKKGRRWVVRKYFRTRGDKRWTFFGTSPEGVPYELYDVARVRIWRHVKVRNGLNPYAPEWQDYIEKRTSATTQRIRWSGAPAPWREIRAGS